MATSEHGQTPAEDARAHLTDAFRGEYARVVASVLRIVRDIDAAEEDTRFGGSSRSSGWRPNRPQALPSPPRDNSGDVSIGDYRALDQTYEAFFAFDRRWLKPHTPEIAEALTAAGCEALLIHADSGSCCGDSRIRV